MIAVEENVFQSNKTEASLHNGRSTSIGAQYYRVGAASNTPSIQINKDVVTVEEVIDVFNIECYAPIHYNQIFKHCNKHIITEPLIPSFIFVHTSQEEVDAMLHDKNVNSIESHPLLSYYYDHTSYRQDNPERNPPLVIRDEAMDNFIKLTSVNNPHIIPVTSQNIQYKLGDHVIVTEGDFEGIQGRVARIAGQQRVIVELFSGCLVATAYIPKEAMRKIIDI